MVKFSTASLSVTSLFVAHQLGMVSSTSETQAGSIFGDGCTSNTPVFDGFAYPKFGNSKDQGVKGNRRSCSASLFYHWNFPVDIMSQNGTLHENVGCKEAIRKRKNDMTFGNETIPGDDDTDCCDASRLRDDTMLKSEVLIDIFVNFTIDEYYPGQQQEFKQLCEQLWACTSYQEMFSVYECEASGARGCTSFSNSSLCFAGAYDQDDDDHKQMRENFIVQSCFGAGDSDFDFDTNVGYSIETLTGAVEVQCTMARDLSHRLLFVPVSEPICDEIVDCLVADANAGVDGDPFQAEDFAKIRYDLCNGTLAELEEARYEVCDAGVNEELPEAAPRVIGDGVGDRVEPSCPTHLEEYFRSFPPQYPGGQEYKRSVATINEKALVNGLEERAKAEYIAKVAFTLPWFQSSVAASIPILEGLPEEKYYMWKVLLWTVPKSLEMSLEEPLKKAWLHNKWVNSAEIEALYENTRQLIDGSAALYDEVVCRSAKTARRGHGCDSVDNTCDQNVDELDEDRWSPEIDISGAVRSCTNSAGTADDKWFWTESDALDCIKNHVKIQDDCDEDLSTATSTVALAGTCDNTSISLYAIDQSNNDAAAQIDSIYVDTEDPVVWCSFADPTDTIDYATRFHDNKTLYMKDHGDKFVDVGLRYGASDNCGGDLEVTVDIYVNEFEIKDNHHNSAVVGLNGQTMSVFYDQVDGNGKAGLYVEKDHCNDNGRDCIEENGKQRDHSRLYTVVVSAKDLAGRVSFQTAECSIIVGDEKDPDLDDDVNPLIESSSGRFVHVQSHASTIPSEN